MKIFLTLLFAAFLIAGCTKSNPASSGVPITHSGTFYQNDIAWHLDSIGIWNDISQTAGQPNTYLLGVHYYDSLQTFVFESSSLHPDTGTFPVGNILLGNPDFFGRYSCPTFGGYSLTGTVHIISTTPYHGTFKILMYLKGDTANFSGSF